MSSEKSTTEGSQVGGIASADGTFSVPLGAPQARVANAVANEIDDDEAALLDRIADAEMAGRTTIAEALSRRLQSLREAKARGLVVLATERERRR